MVATYVPGPHGPIVLSSTAGGGSSPATATWTDSKFDGTAATVIDYGTLSIGTANANRVVVVAIADRNGSASSSVSSVSIGGNAATQVSGAVASAAFNFILCDIWYLAVPTGTTANITVTYANANVRGNVDIYSVITTTPTPSVAVAANSTSTSLSAPSITVPTNGVAIAVYGHRAPASANAIGWTNATADQFVNSTSTFGSGHTTATGAIVIDAAISGASTNDQGISVAAWGP